jgi:hypothetical protein
MTLGLRAWPGHWPLRVIGATSRRLGPNHHRRLRRLGQPPARRHVAGAGRTDTAIASVGRALHERRVHLEAPPPHPPCWAKPDLRQTCARPRARPRARLGPDSGQTRARLGPGVAPETRAPDPGPRPGRLGGAGGSLPALLADASRHLVIPAWASATARLTRGNAGAVSRETCRSPPPGSATCGRAGWTRAPSRLISCPMCQAEQPCAVNSFSTSCKRALDGPGRVTNNEEGS